MKLKHLFLVLLAQLIFSEAFAYDAEIDGIYYTFSETEAAVTYQNKNTFSPYYQSDYSGDIVIPNEVTYNGKEHRVTSIGEGAFYGCSGLTSITIPNSVTSIGEYAFYKCSSLKAVNIPKSVTSIGISAFYGCNGLTSITIPSSVTSIADYTFRSCSSLTSVIIPEGVIDIGKSAFSFCFGLSSVTIPSSVKSIGAAAFEYCSDLTSVHITDLAAWCNISFDRQSPFSANPLYYAKHLYLNGQEIKDLIIPEGVTTVSSYAFLNCSDLTSVTIPNSLTSIGVMAFRDCSGLTSVHITDLAAWCSISFDGYYATPFAYATHLFLNGQEVCNLEIPEGVTSIAERAFSGCSNLTAITIPASVTTIGEYAFSGCSALTGIQVDNGNTEFDSRENCNAIIKTATNTLMLGCINTIIPKSVTSIEYAFSGCSNLTSIIIPESVTNIGVSAFYGCSGLTSFNIPESVTSIGDGAFESCTGLTSITIPSNVTSIGAGAFTGCSSLTKVIVPDIAAWCSIAFGFQDYSYITGNPLSEVHHLYSDEDTEITHLVIPGGVTSIGNYAFSGCSSLKSITIPNSVTSIGNSAFSACRSLESINIPESVTSIGNSAFSACSGLTSINIPSSVTSIGESTFYNCTSLTAVTSYITNPFPITQNVFMNWDEGDFSPKFTTATLYVPQETKSLYKATEGWNAFQNIVEIDVSGVEVAEGGEPRTTSTYHLSGHRLPQPQRGINIIRSADGKTHKVLIK